MMEGLASKYVNVALALCTIPHDLTPELQRNAIKGWIYFVTFLGDIEYVGLTNL